MTGLRVFFYQLLKLPSKIFVKCRLVADPTIEQQKDSPEHPIFYVVRHQSASDILALKSACKQLSLPDPLKKVEINGQSLSRIICLEKPTPVFRWRDASPTRALSQGQALLELHSQNQQLDGQLIPAHLLWGRKPSKELNKANVGTVLADRESPSWLRKFFIVLFLGRNATIRFSEALSLREMTDKHGHDENTAHKLLRVARFHFHRQTIAATGPRLMYRDQMFKALLANPSVKRVIEEEAKSRKTDKDNVKKEALKMMNEIAGDYRESMIHLGERVLNRLWNRLYSKIEVNNAKRLREVAQSGDEIIYVPCHRSHMDYLLLTWAIYQQGLVTPRIAAGINLNFWPAGPIFRKAGAFFIRRTFGGNRLYSTIFREYLGLLFEKGYSVKYYTEGGRSRTGKLLPPKTGMLAMTIQSLLRGVDRPLTLVPVYLGYEHVMEVGTYHKELSGSKKQSESIFGVFKAIKSLRNYGRGYVNFGEPINVNRFLDSHVENWQDAIDPIDPQKPSWLTPSVNHLADNVMVAINKSVALNGVSLIAIILHATPNKAMSKSELLSHLAFFLTLQRVAPYSDELTIPCDDAEALLEHVISLNKLTIEQDSFGDIVSLTDSAKLEMRYYRNNILHAYVIHALVCRSLARFTKLDQTAIIQNVQQVFEIIQPDFYLWQDNERVASQTQEVLTCLAELNIVKESKAGFWSVIDCDDAKAKVEIMGECIDEVLQRITIVTSLLSRLEPMTKAKFEEQIVAIAKRLSVVNNINAPEFIDKKAQTLLVNSMKNLGYISIDDNNHVVANEKLQPLKSNLHNLVEISVLQNIAR